MAIGYQNSIHEHTLLINIGVGISHQKRKSWKNSKSHRSSKNSNCLGLNVCLLVLQLFIQIQVSLFFWLQYNWNYYKCSLKVKCRIEKGLTNYFQWYLQLFNSNTKWLSFFYTSYNFHYLQHIMQPLHAAVMLKNILLFNLSLLC